MSNDQLILEFIFKMNLDIFWSIARSNVLHVKRQPKVPAGFSEMVGLKGAFEHQGPSLCTDHCRYEVDPNILLYSISKGRHDKTYT